MCLGNALTLMSIYAEGEEDQQEASSEAELHGHSYEEPPLPAWSGGTSSASLRTPVGSSQPMTGAASAVRTQPHYSVGKDPANDDDPPYFHIHHHQWDPWQQDEIGMF